MGLLQANTKKKEIQALHFLLNHSFKNVQKDTASLFSHLHVLYNKQAQNDQQIRLLFHYLKHQHGLISSLKEKNTQLESLFTGLKEGIQRIPSSKEEFKKLIEEIISFNELLERLRYLDEQILDIRKSHSDLMESHLELRHKHSELTSKTELQKPQKMPQIPHPSEGIELLSKRLEKLEERRSKLKDKLITRIAKNTKGYIKNLVLSYIQKYGTISALQLKEMVVQEQGLCSKSSFYRLLEEIEKESDVGTVREGKEKRYISKMLVSPSAERKRKKKK